MEINYKACMQHTSLMYMFIDVVYGVFLACVLISGPFFIHRQIAYEIQQPATDVTYHWQTSLNTISIPGFEKITISSSIQPLIHV